MQPVCSAIAIDADRRPHETKGAIRLTTCSKHFTKSCSLLVYDAVHRTAMLLQRRGSLAPPQNQAVRITV